jgi:glyoxylase-like metal-dependent hydrolase (beta-lactamase superfamily II)
VENVVLAHLHYDHAGTVDQFPRARFQLQDKEMAYATGRWMTYGQFGHSFEPDDICHLVRALYDGRMAFVDGEAEIAPGITLHHIGGHTAGVQCMRVWTERGWVVLASDTSHYYEHFEKYRVFPTTFNLGDVMKGYETLRRLADSMHHIVFETTPNQTFNSIQGIVRIRDRLTFGGLANQNVIVFGISNN